MKYKIEAYVLLFVCFVCVSAPCAEEETGNIKTPGEKVMISLVKFEVNDKHLELHYIVHNEGTSDIWFCTDINHGIGYSHERLIGDEDHQLLIRQMHNVPWGPVLLPGLPIAMYTRIGAGQKRPESINIPIPVESRPLFAGSSGKRGSEIKCTSISLRFGYYQENLPQKVIELLSMEKQEGVDSDSDIGSESIQHLHHYLGGPEEFSELNDNFDNKNVVLIPYTNQLLKGEKTLEIAINGVLIPCKRL